MGTAIGDLLVKQPISLDFLAGKKVGVDTYNILYQFLSSIRGRDGTPLMDSHGNVTSHLTGLFYRTINLMQRNIKPVFIFDGKPSELKRETLRKRVEVRTEAEARHKEALKKGELEEARKFGSRALKLTLEMREEAMKLIELMGLPLVQAKGEGEAQIAYMVSKKELFGCVSQDFDSLLFGTEKLLRNITVSGRRKLPGKNIYIDIEPELIELEKSLDALGIDRRKLVWIGILIGTDFNEKFPKIGPKTALKLVKEHDSFEGIIAETNHSPDFDHREIEALFLRPEIEDNYSIEFREPDAEKVKSFLCGRHDFSVERVDNALKKLSQALQEKGEQSKLGDWS